MVIIKNFLANCAARTASPSCVPARGGDPQSPGRSRVLCLMKRLITVMLIDGIAGTFLALPVAAQVDQPASVTYWDPAGHQNIFNFAVKSNSPNHLCVNYWDGAGWHWADQGLPSGIAALPFQRPAAVTYSDQNGRQVIFAFVVGPNGHLYVNYWDGFRWNWADQGLPPKIAGVIAPSAITYQDSAGNRLIHVFVLTNDGRLCVNYWNGSAWNWADLGFPRSSVLSHAIAINLAAATYPDSAGLQHIYVFTSTKDGALYVDHWNGFNWSWSAQGLPPGERYVWAPAPVAFQDSHGNQVVYCFVSGYYSSHLYVNYFDGYSWKWADQGIAPDGSAMGASSAITVQRSFWVLDQNIFVFVATGSQHLAVNYWDGSNWHWADQGVLPVMNSAPSAISYWVAVNDGLRLGGYPAIYAFVPASGNLYVNYWDSVRWNWANLGGV